MNKGIERKIIERMLVKECVIKEARPTMEESNILHDTMFLATGASRALSLLGAKINFSRKEEKIFAGVSIIKCLIISSRNASNRKEVFEHLGGIMEMLSLMASIRFPKESLKRFLKETDGLQDSLPLQLQKIISPGVYDILLQYVVEENEKKLELSMMAA